jgi:hypothetical protein
MSRCFKHYDVKQLLRHGGCVPATREGVDGLESLRDSLFIALLASLASQ